MTDRRSSPRRSGRRPLHVAAGLAASAFVPTVGDRAHPVAWFGRVMSAIEDRLWRDRRRAGVAYAALGTTLGAAAGITAGPATAMTVSAAGRQLRGLAGHVADLLDDEDLDGARAAIVGLVGRDPTHLDHSGLAAAAIESVAENMVDAVAAPVVWGLLAGGAGVGAHRSINTMDAMVGHHNERYERFGWAAARLDDAAAFVPARVLALGVMAVEPRRARTIAATIRADAGAHPSPNAGVAEAAMAAALGCQLGGPLRYGSTEERRPTLGDGPRPSLPELRRAIQISERVEQLLVVLCVASALGPALRRRRRPRRWGGDRS